MLKIKSLNKGSSTLDEDGPCINKEAEEVNALEKYNNALKHQHMGDLDNAEKLLLELINVDIPNIEKCGGLIQTISKLKYSCYLNSGYVHEKKGHLQKALDNFLFASEVDSKDVMLWWKIGNISIELNHFHLAVQAFYEGLECSSKHWPTLDLLISLLYALRDFISCLFIISRALQINENYVKGLMLRKRIFDSNPAAKNYYGILNPDSKFDPPINVPINEEDEERLWKECQALCEKIKSSEKKTDLKSLPVLKFSKPLTEYSWVSVGEVLVHMHEYMKEHNLNHLCKIRLDDTAPDLVPKQKTEMSPVPESSANYKEMDIQTAISNSTQSNTELGEILKEGEKEIELPSENISCNPKEHISPLKQEVGEFPIKTDETLGSSNFQNLEITDTGQPVDQDPITEVSSDSFGKRECEPVEQESPVKLENESDVKNPIEIKEDNVEPQQDLQNEKLKQECHASSQESVLSTAEIAEHKKDTVLSQSEIDEQNAQLQNDPIESQIDSQITEEADDSDRATKKSDARKSNRSGKKRRSSLSFLQPWAWHSKRKSTRKSLRGDRDDSIEDAFQRIIPSALMPTGLKIEKYQELLESSPKTPLEVYQEYLIVTDQKEASKAYVHLETDPYFGSDEEKKDIEIFLKTDFKCCDIIYMLQKYVIDLACKWDIKWPPELVNIYLEAYDMYRQHFDYYVPWESGVTIEELLTDVYTILLSGELLCGKKPLANSLNVPGEFSHGTFHQLDLICKEYILKEAFWKTYLRLQWLRVCWLKNEKHNDLAIFALEEIIGVISSFEDKDSFELVLPNCDHNNRISLEEAKKCLQSIELLRNIDRLDDLYSNQKYAETIEILQSTFDYERSLTQIATEVDRQYQLVMLLHALWYTNKEECFVWSEICLNEAYHLYLTSETEEKSRWEKVILKCLLLLEACIKDENIAIVDKIPNNHQTRLVENLTTIIHQQLKYEEIENCSLITCLSPWYILHYILERREHLLSVKNSNKRQLKSSDQLECTESSQVLSTIEEDIPSSLSVLFVAHDFLGRKNWCMINNGQLLLFIVDSILYRLDTPVFEKLREKIDPQIEQAFFCLYQYPNKKNKASGTYISRHLADHGVDPISLSWERAQNVFEFYRPEYLPEFDSYRTSSITSDVEQLLLRITALVPTECDPQPYVKTMKDFIKGRRNKLPESRSFPHKVSTIFYLLGDYYFKLNELGKSIRYLILDLTINPERLDSWADIALATASQIETKLNHCEPFKSLTDFLERVRSAQICFERALKLSNGLPTLRIEFGAFSYTAHGYCSRALKEADALSIEQFSELESKRDSLLAKASDCFNIAINWDPPRPGEHDERWLHNYMLGKIAEKQKNEPSVFLAFYAKSAKYLEDNNAQYPLKINYTNPQTLSMEALELHYRIHASILKYLECHNETIPKSVGRVFQDYINRCATGPFYQSTGVKRPLSAAEQSDSVEMKKCTEELSIVEEAASTLEGIITKIENIMGGNKQNEPDKTFATPIIPQQHSIIKVKNIQELIENPLKVSKEAQKSSKSQDSDVETNEKTGRASMSRRESNATTTTTTTTTSSSGSSDSSSSDSSSSTSDSESSESESSHNEKKADDEAMSSAEVDKLVNSCIEALEQCVLRFPQNYKALFRLAHFYLNSKNHRDLRKCKQLLMSEYQCKNKAVIQGLFTDRKTNNFFNGVWRIPHSEIDRAGSFAAHMSRCAHLVTQVLRETGDHRSLLDLGLQLRRKPDPDKVYIKDTEREQLSEQALSLCAQAMRNASKTAKGDALVRLILDAYRAHQRIQKYNAPQWDSAFNKIFIDVYIAHTDVSSTTEKQDPAAIYEAASKFCIQQKAALRTETTANISNISNSSSTLSTTKTPTQLNIATTVAPPIETSSASSLPQYSPSVYQPPVKRTKTGRPRGRPPTVNRHLMAATSRMGRMPKPPIDPTSALFSQYAANLQNLLYPTNVPIDPYMMNKYQEELFRQYSLMNQMISAAATGAASSTGNLPSTTAIAASSKTSLPQTVVKPVDSFKSSLPTTPVETVESKKSHQQYSEPKRKREQFHKSSSLAPAPGLFNPGLSITPVSIPPPVPHSSASKLQKTVQPLSLASASSSKKTLQQKLAEKQKQTKVPFQRYIEQMKQASQGQTSIYPMQQKQNYLQHPAQASSHQQHAPTKQAVTGLSGFQYFLPPSLNITRTDPSTQPKPFLKDIKEKNVSISAIPVNKSSLGTSSGSKNVGDEKKKKLSNCEVITIDE